MALNNADSSTEYVEALCDHVLKEISQALPSLNTNEKGKLESCLSGLSAVTTTLKEIIDYGVQQLRSTAIKPRVNPWVDTFLNINHHFSEVMILLVGISIRLPIKQIFSGGVVSI